MRLFERYFGSYLSYPGYSGGYSGKHPGKHPGRVLGLGSRLFFRLFFPLFVLLGGPLAGGAFVFPSQIWAQESQESQESSGELPVLRVYTYDSFSSEWGPGPRLQELFEATCACQLVFVPHTDAVTLLTRLQFEGSRAKADVILGLDTTLMHEAQSHAQPHGLELPETLRGVEAWDNEFFVPFDWGFFAFVYDARRYDGPPLDSFEALRAAPVRLLIQDPRSASPGLGLVLWIQHLYGSEAAEVWGDLNPKIVTVTADWSTSYQLFLQGEADMVLSYATSPFYHRLVEGEDHIRAFYFQEGHYQQTEVAALAAQASQPDLARRFLSFLLSPEAQSVLPTHQWMYPVHPDVALPEGFDEPPTDIRALTHTPEEVARHRRTWTQAWLDARF